MFKEINTIVEIKGSVTPQFEKMREVFEENFTKRGEIGAAYCVYHKGEKVVDLWGGYKDKKRTQPWDEDTLVMVFSTTKGVSAMAFSLLHSKGWMDYDEKVATYWPEFARNGKENITVRQLLGHQAGLCAIDTRLTYELLTNPEALSEVLARQKPLWDPGTKKGYHAWTIGLYMNELVQRIDPAKRTLSQFLQEELAGPLEAEFFIGLPDEISDERVADLVPFTKIEAIFKKNKRPGSNTSDFLKPWSLLFRTLLNPRFTMNLSNFNKRKFRRLAIGSACGFGNARSLAAIYSEFATQGKKINIHPSTLETLESPAIMPTEDHVDLVLKEIIPFHLGFGKPGEYINFGSNHRAFGNLGAGGSGAFSDPETQTSSAYVMNKMGLLPANDPRELALRIALMECLQKMQ